jgi:hypothetical protein
MCVRGEGVSHVCTDTKPIVYDFVESMTRVRYPRRRMVDRVAVGA